MTAEELFNQGGEFLDQEKWDEAIETLTRFIEEYPSYQNVVLAYNYRGIAYREKREYDRAIEDLNKAIELGSNNAIDYNTRGTVYGEKGEYDRAIEDFDTAIELKPDFAKAYSNRGLAYQGKGAYDRAVEDCSKAIELDPNNAAAYNNRGLAYQGKREYDRTIEDLNKAIKLDPENAIVYTNRGLAYSGKGEHDRALEDLNKAIELKPDFAKAYSNRGLAYSGKGEHARAIEDLNKAIELQPAFAGFYVNRGLANAKKGEYDRAIEDYEKALELDPDSKDAIHNRAVALALRESNKLGGFREEYENKAKKYEKAEGGFDGQIRRSLVWLVITLAVSALLLVLLPIIQFEVSVRPFLVVFSPSIQSEGSLGFLPWVLLIGLVLSPLAWRISYLRDEKRHNELLKHSYERKAHLETRWAALPQDKTADMAIQLMEHWMERSPEETILAVMDKKDSGSSPLTPAALAVAIAAAVRRAN